MQSEVLEYKKVAVQAKIWPCSAVRTDGPTHCGQCVSTHEPHHQRYERTDGQNGTTAPAELGSVLAISSTKGLGMDHSVLATQVSCPNPGPQTLSPKCQVGLARQNLG